MVRRSPKRLMSVAFSLAFLVISLVTSAFATTVPSVVVQDPVSQGIRSPLRIAIDAAGNLYVTDSLVNAVLKYDAFGHLLQQFKTAGSPQGIFVESDGTMLVGEGDFVVRLAADGHELGRLGSGAGQFKMANGITEDAAGYIYVVDSLDNCVQVFNANGVFVQRFGTFGAAAGQFSTPTGIAYEKNANELAVVDTRNGRVQFFGTDGVYRRTVGSFGANPLKFTAPQGVGFEYSNDPTPVLKRMYVVDTFQSLVQTVDMTVSPAAFLSYIGSYGNGNGKLMVPSDVQFDQAHGRLMVVNGYGNVTVYGIDGGSLPLDTTPPTLAIDPLPSVVYTGSVDIAGAVEAGATVAVAGPATATVGTVTYPTTDTWRVTVTGLTLGSNLFTVTAKDSANNVTTQTATTQYLLAQPQLTLDPVPALTGDGYQQFSGTVDAGCTVTIVNQTTNQSVQATVFGTSWSQRLALAAGPNTIKVIAERSQSATAALSVTTTLDNTMPVLVVSALADGSYTSEQIQNVKVQVSDANLAGVTVNGQPLAVVDGAASTAITLAQGANTITVVATDLVGNVTTNSRTIIYDVTRPVISFTAPADGAFVSVDHLMFSGSVDKTATVTVAGKPAQMSGTSWSAEVSLVPGLNTIDVSAVDLAGNTSSAKRTITYDTEAPAVVITTPAQDFATNQGTICLVGSFTDSSPVTVSADVNGTPVAATVTDNTFVLTVNFTDQGSYAVTVKGTDAAGNVGSVTRTIIYDTTPPALELNAVNTPYPSALSGSVEAGAAVAVEDKNGTAGTVTLNGTAWQATLNPGQYDSATLAVRATDAAGNSTTRSLVVQVPDGDVDGDGTVTIQDALTALRIFTKQQPPTATNLAHGDIGPLMLGKARPNGAIDLVDVLLILRKALGMQSW